MSWSKHSALHVYASLLTLALPASVALGVAASHAPKPRFEEIDVERINVVEADGQIRMVIANRARQHPGLIDGQTVPRPGGRPAGILFFNHLGDECGGLVFDGNGGKGHFISLTMDKSRQDQTIGIQHLESDNGDYFAGLSIWDRPHEFSLLEMAEKLETIRGMPEAERRGALDTMKAEGQLGTSRMLLGKLRDKSVFISLADGSGATRMRLVVDPGGDPRIEFLDAAGEVTKTVRGE